MSVSAVSAIQPSDSPDSLVPRLASENAETAARVFGSDSSSTNAKHLTMWGDDEPSFWDFLDVINPLQHIPIVNDLYREATGDKIGVAARLAGGALFGGGPLGLIAAAANCVLEEASGKDAGSHILALFRDDDASSDGTALASATAPDPVTRAAAAETDARNAAQTGDAKDSTGAKPFLLPGLTDDATAPPPPKAQPLPLVSQAPAATGTETHIQTRAAGTQMTQAQVAQAAEAEADFAPRSLDRVGRRARFMPVPPRTINTDDLKSPPAIGVTVSSSTARSNVPVTGARPNTTIVTPAMAQEMAQTQVQQQATTTATNDWFSTAMMQGLAKYEKAGQTRSTATQIQ